MNRRSAPRDRNRDHDRDGRARRGRELGRGVRSRALRRGRPGGGDARTGRRHADRVAAPPHRAASDEARVAARDRRLDRPARIPALHVRGRGVRLPLQPSVPGLCRRVLAVGHCGVDRAVGHPPGRDAAAVRDRDAAARGRRVRGGHRDPAGRLGARADRPRPRRRPRARADRPLAGRRQLRLRARSGRGGAAGRARGVLALARVRPGATCWVPSS